MHNLVQLFPESLFCNDSGGTFYFIFLNGLYHSHITNVALHHRVAINYNHYEGYFKYIYCMFGDFKNIY